MKIKLCDIFVPQPGKHLYTTRELTSLEIDRGFVSDLSTRLGLDYLEDNTSDGNLCFANSSEVRTEYRTACTKTDIIYFINAVLPKDHFDLESDEILFPMSNANFWVSVKTGIWFQKKIEI